ncbi:tetratricopeptide repeat protein [Desulfobacter sp.]|uniref:tetratricopeptide repeat protein n=1 Tax=Desulfobacter sp. TaxID=2294 RepID=UPI003D0F0403
MFSGFHSKQYVVIIFMVISVTGCSSLKNDSGPWSRNQVDLQKVIDAQMKFKEVKAEPDVVPELTADEYAKRADQFLRNNDTGSAFINYARALEADPDNTRLLFSQALLLLDKGLYSAASLKFKRILEIDPENARAFEGIGQCCFGLEKPDDAQAAFTRAVKIDPGLWKSHSYLGLLAGHRKEFSASIAHYTRALALKPDNIDLVNNLAVSYYLAGDYGQAVILLSKAVQKKGTHKRILNNLALSYCRIGEYDKALTTFLGTADEAAAYNNIGYEYLLNRRYEDAVAAFEKALFINPVFYEKAYNNLQLTQKAMTD